jgi:hypothetical protein
MKNFKRCSDCRNGEHSNYDDNVKLVIIRDPDSKKIIKRAYLCEEHRNMYNDDGYEIK